jgi:hypothetical protein
MDIPEPRTISAESLAEQVFFTTVRVETEDDKGAQFVATAFAFAFPAEAGHQAPFLVTARHVVEGMPTGSLTFIPERDGGPALERALKLKLAGFSALWRFHPEKDIDVAVMPLNPVLQRMRRDGTSVFLRHLPSQLIPTPDQIRNIDAIEEVIFVGYPKGLWDTVNHLPIARRGITASPFVVDFDGLRQFLIDAPVYTGSSGSPVFLWNLGSYPNKTGGLVIGNRCYLLGMLTQGLHGKETSILEVDDETSLPLHSKPMIGLGKVFKSQTIVETITHAFGHTLSTSPSAPPAETG